MQAPLTLLRAAFVRQPFRLGQGVVVMGWSGLTLVLMRVQALSSARVGGLTQTLVWLSAGVASGVLVLLLLALAAQTALRFFSRPSPLGESELALERRRIPSLSASAALAVGMILLASVWFQLGYPSASGLLWCLGASLEALTSGVVFCRLFQARGQEGFWAQITPTLLIPAVGNALVVLAGVHGVECLAVCLGLCLLAGGFSLAHTASRASGSTALGGAAHVVHRALAAQRCRFGSLGLAARNGGWPGAGFLGLDGGGLGVLARGELEPLAAQSPGSGHLERVLWDAPLGAQFSTGGLCVFDVGAVGGAVDRRHGEPRNASPALGIHDGGHDDGHDNGHVDGHVCGHVALVQFAAFWGLGYFAHPQCQDAAAAAPVLAGFRADAWLGCSLTLVSACAGAPPCRCGQALVLQCA